MVLIKKEIFLKARVIRFKSLEIALKELEQFIRDGKHLLTGKPFTRLEGMRSREALANWLLCVASNYSQGEDRFWFSTDPDGGDGIVVDKITGQSVPTEHVMALRVPKDARDGDTLLLEAIAKKVNKGGSAYASGKTLVVFAESIGEWHPTKVANSLPNPLHFDAVWVLGLKEVSSDGGYHYVITRLDLSHGNPPIWVVAIAQDFNNWTVC